MVPTAAVIRLLFIDDSPDISAAVALMLKREADIELVGTLDNADGLIEAIERWDPHVVVIDLSMLGKSPLEAVRETAARFPHVKSIIYSGYDDPDLVDEALAVGAWGFVSKHGAFPELFNAVRRVAAGEVAVTVR